MGRLTRRALPLLAATMVLTACDANRFFSAWVPYWTNTTATAPVTDRTSSMLFSELSPSWFGTGNDTTVHTVGNCAKLGTFVNAARSSGLPVIPTVFDSTGAGVMASIVKNAGQRASHVQHLVDLVTHGGVGACQGAAFDGIDLDYEQFAFADGRASWSATQPAWIAFVTQLADALHAKGKLLSVTVPPTWNNPVTQAVSGYWVYDLPHLGPLVDRLRLMVYDWSVGQPGPIAPLSWVDQVITYTKLVAGVPAARVQLGIPAYGRHWVVQKNPNEVCPEQATHRESITMPRTAALAADAHRTPTRDASGELTFTWDQIVTGPRTTPPTLPDPTGTLGGVGDVGSNTGLQPALRLGTSVTCTVHHTVYVPDATNIAQKANRAAAANLSGVVMWALGYETSDIYPALAGVAPQRLSDSSVLTVDPVVTTAAVGATPSTATVTGVAYLTQFDLPVPVTITVTDTGTGTGTGTGTIVASTTLTARAARPDLATPVIDAIGSIHGFTATFTGLAAGNYRACAAATSWGGAAFGASPACTSFVIAPAG